MKHLIAVVLLVLAESSVQASFCDASLCPAGTIHIACNGLTSMAPSCGPEAFEVDLDTDKQVLILDLHNQLRSKIAQGLQNYTSNQYFPQARRMATLVWSDDLAYIAAANARRCVFGHDSCRNTPQFVAAGQNIAIKSYYGTTISDTDLIIGFVDAWYSEYADATPSHIASFPSGGPTIGHFTQIVSDRTTEIGCSLVSYYTSPWINKLFVCNYALTNIISQPVYQSGNTCSACTTGCNAMYQGLCNEAEDINPNPWFAK
ncbi:venom allergen 5-like isoform X2 [Topomyia yanbarensis]|uniref:venom allergen 5-like isoform X2 n=1 Tax=Topomyia yanbarensis TaxID=2498891 RepID=UPI00273C9A06|nr:venom allergen 5-like isoform X2 [Topomyia yanbarensis]